MYKGIPIKESTLRNIAQKKGFCTELVTKNSSSLLTVLCALIGFVKHSSEEPNCEIKTKSKYLSMLYAKREIKQGEVLSADFLGCLKCNEPVR